MKNIFLICAIFLFMPLEGATNNLLIKKAEKLESQEKYQEAEKIWEMLVEKYPQNGEYLYRLAKLYSWTKQYDKAEILFKRALEINPENGDAKVGLGYVYLWTDREKQASELFSEVLQKYPDYEDAKTGLERAETALQEEKEKAEIARAETKAAQLEEEKSYQEAEIIWEYLVKQDPNNAQYLYQLGRIYALTKRYKEAETVLKRSLEINPKNGDAQLRLAYVYLWTDREDQAKELFTQILEEYPDYKDAKTGLEKVAESLKAKEEKKTAEEKPKEKETWQKPWVELAEKFEKGKCYNAAIKIWCFLLSASEENKHEYAFQIGKILSWKGEWNKAAAYLKYALYLETDYAPALLRLGYVALFSGNYCLARQIFWKLLCKKTEKTDPDVVEAFARASQVLTRNCAARQCYCRRMKMAKPTYLLFAQYSQVLRWTDPWVKGYMLYGQERETDLITKVRSAQRNTFASEATYYYPLTERQRLNASVFAGAEREINLVTGGDNFSVLEWIYGLGYEQLINPWLTGRVWANLKEGRDIGTPDFPFGFERRFEPGGVLLYNDPKVSASISAVRDSFIVKDFSNFDSYFLPRDTYLGRFEYNLFNSWMYAGILGFYRYYHDHPLNRQWEGEGWVTIGYPQWEPCLFLQYRARNSGFKFTQTDYYSYDHQWEHFGKIYLIKKTILNTILELGYQRSWQWSRDLNQPVSSPVFVQKLFRITNRAYLELRHLPRPNLNLIFRTELYTDTTKYDAWLTRGEINYIF